MSPEPGLEVSSIDPTLASAPAELPFFLRDGAEITAARFAEGSVGHDVLSGEIGQMLAGRLRPQRILEQWPADLRWDNRHNPTLLPGGSTARAQLLQAGVSSLYDALSLSVDKTRPQLRAHLEHQLAGIAITPHGRLLSAAFKRAPVAAALEGESALIARVDRAIESVRPAQLEETLGLEFGLWRNGVPMERNDLATRYGLEVTEINKRIKSGLRKFKVAFSSNDPANVTR